MSGQPLVFAWWGEPVGDDYELPALVCAVDVPKNRRPGSYFWTSRGERVVRIAASPPRPARPRRLRS